MAGATVSFTTTGGLPTNFATGTNYYVLPTGLTGTTIQVSATPFGTAISAGSAGTGTQTAHTEVALTSTQVSNVAALLLSPGYWQCNGTGAFDQSGATVTYEAAWITSASATQPPDPGIQGAMWSFGLTTGIGGLILNQTIKFSVYNVAVPTIVYLEETGTFSAGSMLGYGELACVRTH
jgi:hypothetical protein